MYFRPPRGHKILESHKICSSVINLGKKSLILGKVIKNHKISFIHFSGKENCSVWTVLDCSFEEVSVKCWPQTPEHGDIVTVLIHNYYYLQTVNTTSDCTLSFVEFGLCLAPKANQGRQGPTHNHNPHKILKSYFVSSVVLSCLNSHFHCRLFYFQVNNNNNNNNNNSNWSRNA